MNLRSIDHDAARSWLQAAERGDFAHEEKSLQRMVFSTNGGGWGGDSYGGWGIGDGSLLGLLGSSVGTQKDYAAYEREAGPVHQNVAVAACLRVIADNVPQPVPKVTETQKDGDVNVVASPCVDLLRNPNGYYSYHTLMASWINSAVIDGNGYIVKIRSAAGIPVQLWWVPTWTIWPRFYPGQPHDYIDHYEYQPGQGIWRIDPADIIHLRYGIELNPRNDRLMLSALHAAAGRSICSLNECDAFIASLMRNAGVPQIAIVPSRTDVLPPTPDQAEMMRSQYRTLTHGERRGDPFIATGPFTLQKIGYSPEELALDHIPNRLQDDVHGLMGVPAMLTGMTSGSAHKTYSNLAEARRALYEDTIIPIQVIVAHCLTRSLLGDIGMGDNTRQTFGFSYDGIECLQEQRDLRDARAVANYVGGVCTLAEARRTIGLDATDEDDVYQLRLDTRLVQRNQLQTAIEQDTDKLSARVLTQLAAGLISKEQALALLGMDVATTGDTVLLPTTAQPMLQGDPLPNSPEAAAAMTEATAPEEAEPAAEGTSDPFADEDFDDEGNPLEKGTVAKAKAIIAAISKKLGITIKVEQAVKPRPKVVAARIREPLALEVSAPTT